ncbi:DNA photolyase [bacterium]|nr:DNA photolyase [bacterium]
MIETVYVEKKIKEHPRTKFILSKFKKATIIEIDRYGEIFNKRNQNFRIQKKNPDLILAFKNDGYVLSAPEGFGIGSSKNYYFSHMYNCIYDCRYCFLQGMYSSANYVIFVNFEDFDEEIEEVIQGNKDNKTTFFSGYDCDSLALETLTGFAKHITTLFAKYPDVDIEFRTKSVQIEPFTSMEPLKNVIIAYSLLPDLMSKSLDNKTPSILKRINAMSHLADKGWKIGLRFDPLIHGKNWKKLYKELLVNIYKTIPLHSIHSVSFGALRFPKEMFKDIFKLYPKTPLFSGPLSQHNGIVSYDMSIEEEMISFCSNITKNYIDKSQIFKCSA